MTGLTKISYVRCDLCREKVEKGIFSMLEHYEKVHGLTDMVNLSIARRQQKGSRLEEIDFEQFKKK